MLITIIATVVTATLSQEYITIHSIDSYLGRSLCSELLHVYTAMLLTTYNQYNICEMWFMCHITLHITV